MDVAHNFGEYSRDIGNAYMQTTAAKISACPNALATVWELTGCTANNSPANKDSNVANLQQHGITTLLYFTILMLRGAPHCLKSLTWYKSQYQVPVFLYRPP